jgi:APA family basic amino acid/polyamine antiporter
LILGTIALTTIYVTVNVAYILTLPVAEIAGVTRIAEKAVTALVGPIGATLVAASVVISTFGCNVAGVIASSRVCFAMASDGRFFPAAARVHPIHRTPHVALLITSVWSVLLTLTGGYEALFTYVTFASVLFGTLGGLAIFVLRWRRPALPRPYRALGYPVIPALYVLGSFALVWNTLMERPTESIAGLLLVALGLPFYLRWSRPARQAPGRVE